MKSSWESELDFSDPFFVGLGFRLKSFGILFKIIREISIQIESTGVVSAINKGRVLKHQDIFKDNSRPDGPKKDGSADDDEWWRPPSLATGAGSLAGHFESVWIETGQNVDSGLVQQPADVIVFSVALDQMLLISNDWQLYNNIKQVSRYL